MLHVRDMGFRRFTEIRAWQASRAYKQAVYRLIDRGLLNADTELRDQLRDAVKGPPAHIAEGFGRFSPLDFARFAGMAKSSLMESQNHLMDAVDRCYISEQMRLELDALAEVAIKEATGLIQYLQSSQARRNAELAKRYRNRRSEPEPGAELGTELGTKNQEQGTRSGSVLSSVPNPDAKLGN